MLITPEYVFKDVTHITPEFLAGKGIRSDYHKPSGIRSEVLRR